MEVCWFVWEIISLRRKRSSARKREREREREQYFCRFYLDLLVRCGAVGPFRRWWLWARTWFAAAFRAWRRSSATCARRIRTPWWPSAPDPNWVWPSVRTSSATIAGTAAPPSTSTASATSSSSVNLSLCHRVLDLFNSADVMPHFRCSLLFATHLSIP